MKKLLPVLLAIVLAMTLFPLVATATATILPDNNTPVVEVEAAEPVIADVEPQPAEADPGGLDLTDLLKALIGLLATWITTRVIPWIKAKTTQRKYDFLMDAIGVGVQAAEGMYKSGEGAKKMAYVLAYLNRKGFTVDETEIESMVYALFNQYKPTQEVKLDGTAET
jgi:hypothetical protein